MENQNKNDEPYVEYRFCCDAGGDCGNGALIEGIWLDITPDTTVEFLQDGLEFLNSHTRLKWRIEYR
jgi:hypothetical protein